RNCASETESVRSTLSRLDRKAKQEGIPDTESAVTPDLLDDA
ncbi:hypothetical protein, partial [Mycolicibacterium sp. CBMA 361]